MMVEDTAQKPIILQLIILYMPIPMCMWAEQKILGVVGQLWMIGDGQFTPPIHQQQYLQPLHQEVLQHQKVDLLLLHRHQALVQAEAPV